MKLKRLLIVLLSLVMLFSAFPSVSAAEKTLVAHFIDVGQGDSIFIKLPNDQTMLIDAGTDTGGKAVVKYLDKQKIKRIDYLVATHPHEDHIGGLPRIIKKYEIGTVYAPKAMTTTKTYENFLNAVSDKGLSIKTAKAGTSLINESALKVELLAPVKDSYDNLNNYSVIVKLIYNKTVFLMMGDAEAIVESGLSIKEKVDVLKVGHHGSDTSSSIDFLKKVSPKTAIISVGKKNTYGHPSTQALDNLVNAGASIYRTDKSGTVVVTSTGEKITINKKPTAHKASSPVPSPSIAQKTHTPTPSVSAATQTVYVTKTGAKYHLTGCRYLSKSKIPISLSDARKSYEPCSVCNPPR